jgi:hypothetical protein
MTIRAVGIAGHIPARDSSIGSSILASRSAAGTADAADAANATRTPGHRRTAASTGPGVTTRAGGPVVAISAGADRNRARRERKQKPAKSMPCHETSLSFNRRRLYILVIINSITNRNRNT